MARWRKWLFPMMILWLGVTPISMAAYHVALVDRFYPGDGFFATGEEREQHGWLHGMIDLDRDRIREPLYHGDLVSRVLAHPDIEITPFPLPEGVLPLMGILTNLNQIHEQIQAGRPFDAVLLPWESSTLIMAFDPPLRRHLAEDYIRLLEQWGENNPTWALTYQIIRRLETITASGVAVFTIAGNGGSRMINTYSFARGVTAVGNDNPELDHFIADNLFVDLHARAYYALNRVDDAAGRPVGYDLNEDQCPDILLAQLSGGSRTAATLPSHYWKNLVGSSFAAPAALRQYLLGPDPSPACDYPLISHLDGLD